MANETAQREMPKYRTRQGGIHALQIERISFNWGTGVARLHFHDEGFAPLRVSEGDSDGLFSRLPIEDVSDPGYMVQYPDGMRAWIASDRFERAFVRVDSVAV